ncbi:MULTISPECIES: DUF4956 domain-containing protein [Actinomyces]|uniref:DUF4956 domain-containing protein n=1 Tax=Actinomyces TaxID=1654 RepID=UPI000930EA9E|nr:MULTISPECIES: DUF4956 domain-containing protein [Actinomyces]
MIALTTAMVLPIIIDLLAMLILVGALYYPRHRRADLVVAFFVVNIGVLAVASVMANSTISAGLGLFGVLSIIRLRSDEISQREIAYYFASLAIGLLLGMSTAIYSYAMVALVLATLAIGDSTLILGRSGSQQVQFDRAIADEKELRQALEARMGVKVTGVKVIKLDMVNDLTLVDVRYRVPAKR